MSSRDIQFDEVRGLEAVFCEDGEFEVEGGEGDLEGIFEGLGPTKALRCRIRLGSYSHHTTTLPIHLLVSMPPSYPSGDDADVDIAAPKLSSSRRASLFAALESARADVEDGEGYVLPLALAAKEVIAEWEEVEEKEEKEVEIVEGSAGGGGEGVGEGGGVVCPEILHGEAIVEKKSVFVGHVARVKSRAEVGAVMRELLLDRKVARATHNMMAYRIWDEEKERWLADNNEDGEHGAGSKMAELLHVMDAKDVVVVVSRWYGGVLLGPKRFAIINNCAREIILEHGFALPKKG